MCIGDDPVGEGNDVRMALAYEHDARSKDSAKSTDGALDEGFAGASDRLAELVAAEAGAPAPDKDNWLDGCKELGRRPRGLSGHDGPPCL